MDFFYLLFHPLKRTRKGWSAVRKSNVVVGWLQVPRDAPVDLRSLRRHLDESYFATRGGVPTAVHCPAVAPETVLLSL